MGRGAGRLARGPLGRYPRSSGTYALRVGDGWVYEPTSIWGWRAATGDGFVIVDVQGGATHIDASGARTTPGASVGPDGTLSTAAVAWDPARKTLVLFGGALGKRAVAETWEWRDGVWKRAKVKSKPAARGYAQMTWAPPLGGMLVTAGMRAESALWWRLPLPLGCAKLWRKVPSQLRRRH